MAYQSKFTGAEVDSLLEQVQKGEAGGSVTVDSSLSTTSENPVMNKTITEELNKKLEGEVIGTTSPTEGTIGGARDSHNIGSIDLFEQIIAQKQNHNLTQEDKDAILSGKIITTSAGNGVVPTISSNSMGENGAVLIFHFNERLYEMFVMWTDTLCYINGVLSFTKETKLYADTELSETSENAVQNKVVTEKLEETASAIARNTAQITQVSGDVGEMSGKLAELSEEVGEINGIFKGQGLTRSGSLISDASLAVTPFIPYTQGEAILWQFSNETTSVSSSNINIILYDADLNVLDYFGAGISYNRTIPASSVASATAFIRAAIVPNTGAFIQIGGEVAWDEERTIRNELETKLSGKLVCVGKNLYDERIVENGYINVTQTQGAKPSYQSNVAAGYGHSSPIPVISGMTYSISASSYCGGFYVLLLDSEERVVRLLTTDVKDKAITMPNDAAYLVMTTRFGNVDCVNLQVEIGTNATAYEAYRDELSLPIESLPTYIQEATKVAFALKAAQGQEKVYASAGDSLTEGTGAAVGAIDATDSYYPLSGRAQKTYAYMIAKRNKMAWRNYGISGSTMGNITFNGQSHAPFCVDRYANMADNIDVISLWFGVNDSYYGKLVKAEEWLSKTYGKKIYYPLTASQQGTTASDGTPYATNEQYMACITAEEEFNGVNYKGFALYQKQYEGLPTDTDDTTWWGAWNKVLPYLIEKYPFAKIVIITGYGTEDYLYESVKAIAEKYGVLHLDLREYGVTWLEDDSQTTINYDAADFADRTYFKEYASGMVSVNEFRKRTMLYDGLHFNKYGYEYITPFIEKALNL